MGRILVTGAGGFIGRALCPALAAQGHAVVAALRRTPPAGLWAGSAIERLMLGDLGPGGEWRVALRGIDAVIHLAQRAHRSPGGEGFSGEPQRAAALAESAAQAGVWRFVYLSSIKAMGERTRPGHPFRPDHRPQPEDDYGRAKLASEVALREVAERTRLELTIVRPPLVYGPGVGANFRALMRLAASGLPLPFAAVDNRRSLVFRDNLVDLIVLAATHPRAAGTVLLASDGSNFSTPTLIRALAAAQGSRAHLFSLPEAVLVGLCRAPRFGPALSRLITSLEVDGGDVLRGLGWAPRVAPATAIQRTVSSA